MIEEVEEGQQDRAGRAAWGGEADRAALDDGQGPDKVRIGDGGGGGRRKHEPEQSEKIRAVAGYGVLKRACVVERFRRTLESALDAYLDCPDSGMNAAGIGGLGWAQEQAKLIRGHGEDIGDAIR